MSGSLPTRSEIRTRFMIIYGSYIGVVVVLWHVVGIGAKYVVPILVTLLFIGHLNYRGNVRVLCKRPSMSSDDFSGFVGEAITPIRDSGQVKIRGEVWKASSEEGVIELGSKVEVVRLDDHMTLVVKRKEN